MFCYEFLYFFGFLFAIDFYIHRARRTISGRVAAVIISVFWPVVLAISLMRALRLRALLLFALAGQAEARDPCDATPTPEACRAACADCEKNGERRVSPNPNCCLCFKCAKRGVR